MPIVYEPVSGQPVSCSEGRAKDFIRQGYRTAPPPSVAAATQHPEEDSTPPPSSPDPTLARLIQATGDTNVNMASLKDLAALPLIGTAAARKVRDNRPYGSVEDLIAKVPDIDWMALLSKINVNPAPVEETNAADRQTENPPV